MTHSSNPRRSRPLLLCILACAALLLTCPSFTFAQNTEQPAELPTIQLRAFGVPSKFGVGPNEEISRQIVEAFRAKYPGVDPVTIEGLKLPGASRTQDMVPFMQIAGDIAPDVLYVNFRQSQTYIDMKLLYPMDRYVEAQANVNIADGSAMPLPEYLDALRQGSNWPEIEDRVPEKFWPVIRRWCPYETNCPYRQEWGLEPNADHEHIWAYPIGPLVIAMSYDKTLFAEHLDEGLEMRVPKDWDELMRWAKVLTDPPKNQFGVKVSLVTPGWSFLSFLYPAGGEVVHQVKPGEEQKYKTDAGNWVCTLDTQAAATAAYFFARLHLEPIVRNGQEYEGVIGTSADATRGPERYGLNFIYLDDRFLEASDPTVGVGPLPMGPTGLRGSEINSRMCAIFAGLKDDIPRRDAAWNYIHFYDGPQARRIRTERMVEAGLGQFVRPKLLQAANEGGRYDGILRRISPELEQTYQIAFDHGVPEPYGRNCQYVYDQLAKPLGEIRQSAQVEQAVRAGDEAAGIQIVSAILKRATDRINEKMLGNLPPPVQRQRSIVAWAVIAAVIIIFIFVMRKVFEAFKPPASIHKGTWQFGRYRKAYFIMAPAVASIALWMYWPMVKGTVIAFQNYSVTGESIWIGSQNFAEVLYDPEFWYSLKISLIYGLLFMVFGFWVPIALAFLLQEVPTGKVVFRSIYYLPAVLSGVVVIFLWRAFYSPDGMINQILNTGISAVNLAIGAINYLPGAEFQMLQMIHQNWLENPYMVLFFCLLPTVWAGMGPGCLIYLAALKTIPEELYEAADIDGAGISRKVTHVAIPTIKALVMINFIGAMIGAVRGAGGFMLAMTGGGPYSESGGATEVIGLKIFYTTFGYLKFGAGAAMAWVLGAMLIGFTVIQLQRLSKLEFRTVDKGR
jgi:multiple sugar transport system permease protein